MIRSISFLLFTILLFGPGDGKKKGRKGNALYAQEQYAEAVEEFRLGVSAVSKNGPGPVYSGLLNNLGASLYRTGDTEQAEIAFSGAAQMASTPEDLVRASYNAGNAAATGKQLEQALSHYRRALMSDPSNTDAKFNYEFVKRQLEEQQQQDQQKDDQNQDENKENKENEDQQKGDQDQENEKENQDQQQQDEQNPQDQSQEEQQQQQEQEQPDPTKMSEEEADRILDALQNEEEQLLRQVQKLKTRPRRVEKDW
jgi:Ca-activated chloride channel homolog